MIAHPSSTTLLSPCFLAEDKTWTLLLKLADSLHPLSAILANIAQPATVYCLEIHLQMPAASSVQESTHLFASQ